MTDKKKPVVDKSTVVNIKPPKFHETVFHIKGITPLVIHRFSAKTKQEMLLKMETGRAATNKKNREPKSSDVSFEEAYYRSSAGWHGVHAAAFRNAIISACRLAGFKMTLAKLAVFIEPDGVDEKEPQIPLVRIEGKVVKQEDMARVANGNPYVTIRAAYHDWTADVRVRFDSDQFTVEDVTNLMLRVGLQVGIGEGRPDSKNSAGMGWGLFAVMN